MDPNNPRPHDHIPTPKTSEGYAELRRNLGEHGSVDPAKLSVIAMLTAYAAAQAMALQRAFEILHIRQERPELLTDIEPENALGALAGALQTQIRNIAAGAGISDDVAVAFITDAQRKTPPDIAAALAACEAAHVRAHGAEPITRPAAPDLSKLI
jgi:phosphoglycolate phosphatase-like HAD superfamily hydrolase